VGVEWVKCIHVNDSKRALGSRVDRHEQIGEGHIGLAGFRNLVNDDRFFGVPKILETPKGTHTDGRELDVVNLARLRRLVRRKQRAVRQ
jgi:deoxyribonuclease-4